LTAISVSLLVSFRMFLGSIQTSDTDIVNENSKSSVSVKRQ